MATALSTLKNWFKTGLKPTQEQFWNWMDSFWHKDENIPQEKIEGLPDTLSGKADNTALTTKADLVDGKVPLSQLPLVDDVLEFATFSEFPAVGEAGKLYIDLSNDKPYLWDTEGNQYKAAGVDEARLVALETGKVDKPGHDGNWILQKLGDIFTWMDASEFGKNMANSALVTAAAGKITQGANYIWDAANYMLQFVGLADKSADSTYNRMMTQNSAGQVAWSNGKQVLINMPATLTDAEKTTWKTAMNVGNDTLESVVQRGNYTPKPIKFGDPASPYYFGINKNNFNIRFSKTDIELDEATGTSNIGIGFQTLLNLTSGASNISIGGWSGRGLTTGKYNTILGSVAGYSLSTGEYNLFVGSQSGRNSTTGNSNTFVGEGSGFGNTTGFKNVFVGTAVAYQSTTGNINTLIGYRAGIGSVLGDRNTFIGSGAGQNTSGSNNVFIGVGAGGNDGTISNKLIIHSNHTLSGYSNTAEGSFGSFQQSTLSLALITGDFVERWFKLNGTFKVANGYMAEVGGNAAFTRVVMYNPTTEEFGKANILDLPFIPLSGTTAGKPVTGKIEFSVNGGGTIESGVAKLSLTDGYIQLVSGILKGFYINPGQTMLRHGNLKYINLSDEFDYIVISAEADGPGLVSPYYHGEQYTENSFIQKKYSDLQHSFTTSERLTQGTWIDGKPVYQITLELTDIPRSGIVNLTGLVPGILRIVASDVFTEWASLNLVFAGQVYRNDEVNVAINITPFELRIKNFITDVGYELIDRILLTIQYTKTED